MIPAKRIMTLWIEAIKAIYESEVDDMKKVFILALTLLMTMSLLVSCGGGNKESNKESSKNERIEFHELSFTCPEGYVFDEEGSDEDTIYYKLFDDEGNLQKRICFMFIQLDTPENVLEPANAKAFCEGATGEDGMRDYSGYEIVKYNDELSALEYTFKIDVDDVTFNNTANTFCDNKGGIYNLLVSSLGDDSLDILNSVVDSMKYTFDVYESSGETEESGDEADSEKEESESNEEKDESDLDPEFKATMDSYEAFFDEYVEFMKKYKNSSDTAAMLTDYAEYMTKYTDYMNKLNELDKDEMTAAELAYYTEVNARIMKKLAEVA